jgi:uncharacterized membrane protein YphA (DoxX/SURF4 family)
MKSILEWLTDPPTDGPKSIAILRIMAGGVFLWEGILKFVYANQGIGRFTKLGMPLPHFTVDFVAGLEIGGGVLLLSGLLTRLIAIPFIFEMIVVITVHENFSLPWHLAAAFTGGAPEDWNLGGVARVRSEYAQLLTLAFLLINGPGKWSLDALPRVKKREANSANASYEFTRRTLRHSSEPAYARHEG